MSFAAAEAIANAVLYEGYALYPYRASSIKNRVRWQFGVVAPREYAEANGTDPWFAQTECLIEPQGEPSVDVRVRFLQPQPQAGGLPDSDEGIERTVDAFGLRVAALCAGEHAEPIADEGGALHGWVRVSVTPVGRFSRIRVRIENISAAIATSDRGMAMRSAFVGTHTLIGLRGGRFISLLDPPDDAAEFAAACSNIHTWPVLIGDGAADDTVLSSPIILYDHPVIAPESPGDLFDATEIDEILTLRILTLTDEEKQRARETDARARVIIDRVDSMTPETLSRLHGVMRDVPVESASSTDRVWRELLNPPDEAAPEDATIEVNGVRVAKGSRVVVQPKRRADPMDMFIAGRVGRVEGVYRDVDGRAFVALVLDDDAAGDLHAEFGRFFYYGPEEIEPI